MNDAKADIAESLVSEAMRKFIKHPRGLPGLIDFGVCECRVVGSWLSLRAAALL